MKEESIFIAFFFFTVIVSLLVIPDTPSATAPLAAESRDDRCHDPRLEAEWRQIRDRAPQDRALLRTRALRVGLCQMLEQGEISPQQIVEIWNPEPSERAVSSGSF